MFESFAEGDESVTLFVFRWISLNASDVLHRAPCSPEIRGSEGLWPSEAGKDCCSAVLYAYASEL